MCQPVYNILIRKRNAKKINLVVFLSITPEFMLNDIDFTKFEKHEVET